MGGALVPPFCGLDASEGETLVGDSGSRGATALVGMSGFVVGAEHVVDDELWLFVETNADVVGCPGCGTRATGHGRVDNAVRVGATLLRPSIPSRSQAFWF